MNMLSLYVQSGIHMQDHWLVIVVTRYNPTVLMFVDINEAPKLYWHFYQKQGHLWPLQVVATREKIWVSSYWFLSRIQTCAIENQPLLLATTVLHPMS